MTRGHKKADRWTDNGLFSQLLLLLFLLLMTPTVFADDVPVTSSSTSSSVSQKTLQAKIKEVEASTSLDEKARTQLVEMYRKTLSFQETTQSNIAATQRFSQARKTAASKTKKIRAKLEKAEKSSAEVNLHVSARTPADEVEQRLLKEKANLAALEAKLADIQQQLANESERSTAAGKRLSEAKTQQAEIASKLSAPKVEGESPQVAQARRWQLQAQSETLRSETRMLDAELLSQPMRVDLLEAQRDETRRSVKRATTRVRLLTDLLHERQRLQADLAAEKAATAEVDAQNKHPIVQALAEKNALLSDESSRLVSELARVSAGSDVTVDETKRIGNEFKLAKQKLEISSVSQALGQVLLEQRRALPDVALFEAEISEREGLIADASLRQIQLEEESKALRTADSYIDSLTQKLPTAEAKEIRDDLLPLVKSRRVLLKKTLSLNKSFLRALGEFDGTRRELIKVVNQYDEFLAERLLWIRSAPPISFSLLPEVSAQAIILLSPSSWLDVGSALISQFVSSPLFIFLFLLLVILFLKKPAMYRSIRATAKLANNPLRGKISDTLKALGLTLLLAASWPLLLALLGWQLGMTLAGAAFTAAVSEGLLKLALVFFCLSTFYVLMGPGGVGAAHFNWSTASLKLLRRGLFRFMAVFLPLIFITVFFGAFNVQALGQGLGRLSLLLALGLLAFSAYRLFGLRSKILAGSAARANASRVVRLRYVWLFIGVLVPLLLIGIAMLGYTYTAATLTGRLVYTLWLASGLFIVQQLAVRWLTMTQRRIKYQALLDQRAEAQKAEETEVNADAAPALLEEPKIDFVSLDMESRKLLNTAMAILSLFGLWMIWAAVLPAFGVLGEITLWHTLGTVDGEQQLISVTFADVGLALLIAVMTYVAVRSVPALIELVLLQRLTLEAGSSYATTTLTRYVIASVGTLLALSTVGASWSQVQWLVAALSVGIGFGLQEIVANFISGLIILFERPIRVGDVVTVGDSTGTVTRIQIRATTILTYDRQELLVPNKEFITGRLLNWSLSDQVSRISLPVGLAYGGDVDLGMSIMKEVAEANERVLSEPNAFVTFESFGDNSLLLKLRCFVGSIDHRLAVISELHEEINRRFAEADLCIAFPQRDIHLDTSSPLDIRIHQANATS